MSGREGGHPSDQLLHSRANLKVLMNRVTDVARQL